MKQIVLGSGSPRRQAILKELGLPFILRIPEVDESEVKLKDPLKKVEALARLKAEALPILSENEIIVTADTIVAYKGKVFEKPKNENEAYHMIEQLQGDTHQVITAVALRSTNKEEIFSVTTDVEFWDLSEETIRRYIKTDEPYDKAGAYGIQGKAAVFVKRINGDYYNVVGLPISTLLRKLASFQYHAEAYIFSRESTEL